MIAFRCRPAVRPVYFDLLTHCFYDAPQSVESLWASDQPVAETYTWHTTLTLDRQTSMPRVGFEPTISAGERPKTYALDRAATGTGTKFMAQDLYTKHFTEISATNIQSSDNFGLYVICVTGNMVNMKATTDLNQLSYQFRNPKDWRRNLRK